MVHHFTVKMHQPSISFSTIYAAKVHLVHDFLGVLRWRMEDGGWRMVDGGWRMVDGGWRMVDGGWRLVLGLHLFTKLFSIHHPLYTK